MTHFTRSHLKDLLFLTTSFKFFVLLVGNLVVAMVTAPMCSIVSDDTAKPYDYQRYVAPIYSSTLKRLKATDIDQEVKERAITCM